LERKHGRSTPARAITSESEATGVAVCTHRKGQPVFCAPRLFLQEGSDLQVMGGSFRRFFIIFYLFLIFLIFTIIIIY
jgi:hypothetical protein